MSSTSEVLPGLQSGNELGDFRLLRLLGQGGMGAVWEAEQISLPRKVALKLLHPELTQSPKHLERFHREAEAGARLNHRHIVGTLLFDRHGDKSFIVQELVPGGRTIADEIDDARRADSLPGGYYREVAERFASIAEALAFAHEQGVIHRDVKPSNILLDPEGTPKIGDFGLARLMETPGMSRTGDIVGTPFYMSPEQTQGLSPKQIGPHCDVFSLGASLYEALSLRRAFEGDHAIDVLDKIRHHDPPAPRTIRPRIPADLSVICMKAMEKRSERRYGSMAEFAADLQRFLRNEPILARPPGLIARSAKWFRRHPIATGATAASWVALIVVSFLLVENRRARLDAEQAEEVARTEATTQRRVADYMANIFLVSDPGPERADQVTARQLLDRGVERIGEDLVQEPAVQARMLRILGAVHRGIGLYPEAESLLRRALELHAMTGEEHSAASADTRAKLAAALTESGRIAEGEELLRIAWRDSAEARGDDARETVDIGISYANNLMFAGKLVEAEQVLQTVIVQGLRRLGADHDLMHAARSILGTVFLYQGRPAEAEPHLREQLAHVRETRDPHDPRALAAVFHLASVCVDLDLYDEAESLYREFIAGYEQIASLDHPYALKARSALATTLKLQGKLEESAQEYAAAEQGFVANFGAEHQDTLILRSNYADLLDQLGRREEAVAMLEETVAVAKDRLGEESHFTTNFQASLVDLYLRQDRLVEAEAVTQELLAAYGDAATPVEARHQQHLMRLAKIRMAQDRIDEAMAIVEPVYGLRQEADPYSRSSHAAQTILFNALVQSGRAEEGFRMNAEFRRGVVERHGPDFLVVHYCDFNQAEMLHQLGRPEEAIATLESTLSSIPQGSSLHATFSARLAEWKADAPEQTP